MGNFCKNFHSSKKCCEKGYHRCICWYVDAVASWSYISTNLAILYGKFWAIWMQNEVDFDVIKLEACATVCINAIVNLFTSNSRVLHEFLSSASCLMQKWITRLHCSISELTVNPSDKNSDRFQIDICISTWLQKSHKWVSFPKYWKFHLEFIKMVLIIFGKVVSILFTARVKIQYFSCFPILASLNYQNNVEHVNLSSQDGGSRSRGGAYTEKMFKSDKTWSHTRVHDIFRPRAIF